MYCNHCGAEIRDGAKFCDKCGGKIEAAQPKQEKTDAKEQVQTPVQPATTEKQVEKVENMPETQYDHSKIASKMKGVRIAGWIIVAFGLLCNLIGACGIFILLMNTVGSVLFAMGFIAADDKDVSKFECTAGAVIGFVSLFGSYCGGVDVPLYYRVIILLCGGMCAGSSTFTYFKKSESF